MVEYLGYGKKLDPVLSRRAAIDGREVALCAMAMGDEGLLVDLSQVEDQITRLEVPRERFLSLLSRKIRIHRWIFDQPSERTLLSLGPYFGEFSWQSIDDPIVCRRILRVKTETDRANSGWRVGESRAWLWAFTHRRETAPGRGFTEASGPAPAQ